MPHQHAPQRIAYLAKKWRDGNITKEEKLEFEEWYEEMDATGDLNYKSDETVKNRIYQSILQRENIKPRRRISLFLTKPLVITSVMFSLLCITIFLWWQYKYPASAGHINITRASSAIHKALLPDGTIIWLKPGATISYPEVFGKTRNVTLTGEALFEVAKDKKHPFIITAGNYTATVLGTSFNIKQAAKNNIELAVFTGKVRIASKEQKSHFKPVNVFPAEKLQTGNNTVKIPMTKNEDKLYVKGTEYEMNFVNTPFHEVADRIEKKFNVTLQYNAEQYINCRLTADVTDQSLQQTLELFTAAFNAGYQITKDKIIINEGGCQ